MPKTTDYTCSEQPAESRGTAPVVISCVLKDHGPRVANYANAVVIRVQRQKETWEVYTCHCNGLITDGLTICIELASFVEDDLAL